MTGLRVVIPLLFAIGVLLAWSATALAAAHNAQMVESGGKYSFSPAALTVHVGDTVTWTNTADAPHTVTSDTAGHFASPQVGGGKTYSLTFTGTGSFAYHCTIHTYMHGTIDVVAEAATVPPTDTAPASPVGSAGWSGALVLVVAIAGGIAFVFVLARRRPA
jgi:plastocyanin